jgi:hypothetical protein
LAEAPHLHVDFPVDWHLPSDPGRQTRARGPPSSAWFRRDRHLHFRLEPSSKGRQHAQVDLKKGEKKRKKQKKKMLRKKEKTKKYLDLLLLLLILLLVVVVLVLD